MFQLMYGFLQNFRRAQENKIMQYSEVGQWLREAGGTLFLPKGGGRFAV